MDGVLSSKPVEPDYPPTDIPVGEGNYEQPIAG